jgi:hypothetical protein
MRSKLYGYMLIAQHLRSKLYVCALMRSKLYVLRINAQHLRSKLYVLRVNAQYLRSTCAAVCAANSMSPLSLVKLGCFAFAAEIKVVQYPHQ